MRFARPPCEGIEETYIGGRSPSNRDHVIFNIWSSFGDPNIIKGYADKCPFCLSRRRRIQIKNRIETVDRPQWRMGEKWTLDFTAMCLKRSNDKNAVGVLFDKSVSRVKVGQALPDHTHICTALDFLWN